MTRLLLLVATVALCAAAVAAVINLHGPEGLWHG